MTIWSVRGAAPIAVLTVSLGMPAGCGGGGGAGSPASTQLPVPSAPTEPPAPAAATEAPTPVAIADAPNAPDAPVTPIALSCRDAIRQSAATRQCTAVCDADRLGREGDCPGKGGPHRLWVTHEPADLRVSGESRVCLRRSRAGRKLFVLVTVRKGTGSEGRPLRFDVLPWRARCGATSAQGQAQAVPCPRSRSRPMRLDLGFSTGVEALC